MKLTKDRDFYIMWIKGTDFHKIGISVNAFKRLDNIQASNPFNIELKAVYPEGEWLESVLKDDVYLNYFRLRGEWYLIKYSDLVDSIEGYLKGKPIKQKYGLIDECGKTLEEREQEALKELIRDRQNRFTPSL